MLLIALGVLLACNSGSGPSGSGASSDSVSDIAITRVVLYRSGIAYIERRGTVEESEIRLQIQPEQINDFLTTLTVIADGGDNIASSINLPIERTVAQDLSSLPPQVRQQGGMLSLLNAFRGAEVSISTITTRVTGRLVGSESLTNDEGNQIRRVTVMTDDGALRQIRVDEITEVNLENDSLEIGLAKSLDVSLGEGDWKPVELTIRLSGEPPHDVFLSYVIEMPTWKPTYRILLDDDGLYIQGWAVVDNISGEDWNDVDLSLVAGTPISFRYDLHSPRFVSRPDLTSRGFAELGVTAPDIDRGLAIGGLSSSSSGNRDAYLPDPSAQREAPRSGRVTARRNRERGEDRRDYQADEPEPEPSVEWDVDITMMTEGMADSADTERLDNLFRYDIAHPITVPDRASALVAIVNEPLAGEDVLYFDPGNSSTTPYRAVRMENTTSFTIERGPLSIYKDGTFVGQAIVPRVGENEMIFVPYSLDGRFRITERRSTGEEGVRLVRIVNSVIYSEIQNIARRTYQITNNSGESARLFVRVPKRTNWTLRTPDPETGGVLDQGELWFVPVDLDGGLSQEFTVEEVTTVTRQVQIWSGLAADTIGLYLSNPDADPEIATVLQTVLEQVGRIAEIERDGSILRRRRSDIYLRMSEVRDNIEILGDTRQSRTLRRELEGRLGDLEEETTALTVDIIAMEEEERELRALISTSLMDLTLDDSTVSDETEQDD
jgi:hypothetical protein